MVLVISNSLHIVSYSFDVISYSFRDKVCMVLGGY